MKVFDDLVAQRNPGWADLREMEGEKKLSNLIIMQCGLWIILPKLVASDTNKWENLFQKLWTSLIYLAKSKDIDSGF